MTDLNEEQTGEEPAEPPKKPRRRRNAASNAPKRTGRFERRAGKAAETIRKLIHIRRPDLDISDKTFVEIVERDADAWGRFLAQLGEWILPVGQLIDLAFGAPLLVLLDLAPSVRAARRDLAKRRQQKKQLAEEQRLAEQEQEGLQQEWEVPAA